jgi:4-hydroxy-tetrahydrodipicolinate reductase
LNIIQVGIIGAEGRMGCMVASALQETNNFQLKKVYTIPTSPNIGKSYSSLIPGTPTDCIIESSGNLTESDESPDLDVVIDFSSSDATEIIDPQFIQNKIPVVIGTTGLTNDFTANMESLCQENETSCVISANYSIGINILYQILQQVALLTSEWEVEIIEAHHHHKADSPSGTALTIANKIAHSRNHNLQDVLQLGRNTTSSPKRTSSAEIGIHSIRAGSIVGDHQVIFAQNNEVLEFSHCAQNRNIFAQGALKATRFLLQHSNEGKIFSMTDIIQDITLTKRDD